MKNNTGVLVVSFGTSENDACRRTIAKVEEDMKNAYPVCRVYRAWTSKMIINMLWKREGVSIFTVAEAMEQMKRDGMRTVLIQPTHLIAGIEYERMVDTIRPYRHDFKEIRIGMPLLHSVEDRKRVLSVLAEHISPKEDEVLVCMGHGTEHARNDVYEHMNTLFQELGYKNCFIGTVEAAPDLDCLLRRIKAYRPKKVILTPLMLVAGDHAKHDMAGDSEDSWKSVFQCANFKVECILKGLGEYPRIRQIYLQHLKDAQEV